MKLIGTTLAGSVFMHFFALQWLVRYVRKVEYDLFKHLYKDVTLFLVLLMAKFALFIAES